MQNIDKRDAANRTAFRMQEAYRWTLDVVADLSDAQLMWQPNQTSPAIRFHLFHIARWADVLRQVITGLRQGWDTEDVAARWGLDPTTLGLVETGAFVDNVVAMAIPFPDREKLFAYCGQVIDPADRALSDIDNVAMEREATDAGQQYVLGALIPDQLSHTARHLGMIECLRGLQGLRGTASI